LKADLLFEKITQETLEKIFDKNPHLATSIGRHDPYDNFLPDGSAKNVYDFLETLEEGYKKVKATVDYESLSDENKIDYKLLGRFCENLRFLIHKHRKFEKDPDAFIEIGENFFRMITRNYAPLEKRIESIASRMEKIPKFLKQFQTRFENSRPVKLWTEMAIETCQQMPALFQFIITWTKGKIPEKTHQHLVNAFTNLQQPLKEYTEWLRRLLPEAEENWALGKEKFEKLLRLRGLGMSSDEIYELGVRYLNELKEERVKLARMIAPEKSVEEVVKEIRKYAPKTFEEALEATREEMESARKFLVERSIATVTEEEKLIVAETPSFLAQVIPFAALLTPAKYEVPPEGVYIVTRPRDPKDLGKHLNYWDIKNTAVHEAFPGHFLQLAKSNRHSAIRYLATTDSLGVETFLGVETVEGWAHYCEQMMIEHGFETDPKLRLIQVNDAIWRAVRIIVDVKLSRGEMTFNEAVEMLVKETGMSRNAAIAEVRRYTETPSYALSYLLGKHMLLTLKENLKKKLGKRFNEKLFHDIITENGYLPMYLLEPLIKQKMVQAKA